MTPEKYPAGSRVLVHRGPWWGEFYEWIIIEWSPSGERLKVRWNSGIEDWQMATYWAVAEVLKSSEKSAAPPSP